MINGFYGLALLKANYRDSAETVLRLIKDLNAKKDWKFYENFDSKTGNPNGVPLCAWSAAAEIILEQNLKHNTLIL
jgi:glycogen debranching enzyme